MRESQIVRATQPSSDLTFASILAILRQRKRVILLTTCALFVLVALYCVIATPHYKSTSIIEVQPSSSDLLSLDTLMASGQAEMGDAMNASLDLQTEVEILQSDTLALKVIHDLDLEQTRDFKRHWSPIGAMLGVFSVKGAPDAQGTTLEDAPERRTYATNVFKNHLKVKPVASTRLIEVSFTNSDPKIAAAVVNHLTRGLMDYGFNTRNTATNQTSEWLENQLADLKKQAHDSQAKVVELQRYTGIYSLGEDAQGKDQVYSATLDQLQQATTALSGAVASRILKGAVYDTVRNGDPELISTLAGASLGTTSSAVQNSLTLLQNLRTQQASTAAQLAQDTSKFGANYPRLADERSNLDSLNKAVAAETTRIGARAKNDFEAARTTENQLQDVYNNRKVQAEKLNDRAIEYGIAKEEADNSRSLYEDLSKRLKEAGVVEGLRSSNISVVSPGRVSAKPSSPNPPLYLGGAVVLGLFFGLCGALYTDITDKSIQSLEMVEDTLGLTFLAVLPTFSKRSVGRFMPSMGLSTKVFREPTEAIDVLEQPSSAFAEAVRGLRISLMPHRGVSSPKVVLVTSAIPKEGKTTVAVNIAAQLAKAGKSILFVECDIRKRNSSLLTTSSSDFSPGLSELLSDPTLTMQTHSVEGAPTMQVLRAGSPSEHPGELLSSDRMHDLLEQWRFKFDYIILDTPPLLEVRDALVLSHMADITLLVARYGFTSKKSLERAYHVLASTSDTRLGVVLNAVDRRSVSYGEYYGYSGSAYYQVN